MSRQTTWEWISQWFRKDDQSGLTKPRKRISNWIESADRASPNRPTSYFVGREEEFDLFGLVLTRIARGENEGTTLVFQGAPGAGKTALMAEISSRIDSLQPDRPGVPSFCWIPVHVTGRTLASPLSLYHGIRRVLHDATGVNPEPKSKAIKRTTETEAEISKIVHLIRTYKIEVPDQIPPEDRTADLTALLRNLSWPDKTGVCLLLDEAQNLADIERTGEIKSVLDSLHQGQADLPVFLTAFGLSDTESVLGNFGISAGRFTDKNVQTVSSLSEEEVRTFLERAFEDFGLPKGQPPWTWANRIVEISSGWPQHLKVVLSEALSEIEAAEQSGREPVWPEDPTQAAKKRYYNGRLKSGLDRWEGLYAKLAGRAVPLGRVDVENEFIRFVADRPLLQKEDFDEFLKQSVHRGVLSYDSDNRLDFPIPSFRAYLTEQFGSDQTDEPVRDRDSERDWREHATSQPKEAGWRSRTRLEKPNRTGGPGPGRTRSRRKCGRAAGIRLGAAGPRRPVGRFSR